MSHKGFVFRILVLSTPRSDPLGRNDEVTNPERNRVWKTFMYLGFEWYTKYAYVHSNRKSVDCRRVISNVGEK